MHTRHIWEKDIETGGDLFDARDVFLRMPRLPRTVMQFSEY